MKRFIILPFLIACFASSASQNAPDPESEHAKVIRFTQVLEQAPLDPAAPDMRAWLIQWAQATPDVSIVVCNVLGPIPGTDVPNSAELLGQYMFGSAAYQLEHPESKNDVLKTQMAGIASLLAAYRSFVQADPQARIPQFDAWLNKQTSGTLETELAPLIDKQCESAESKA